MNVRSKLGFSIVLLSLLCLMPQHSLRADTMYTYTGNAYNGACGASFTCLTSPDAITITLDTTLTVAQLVSQTNDCGTGCSNSIVADIASFTISDGSGLVINNLSNLTTVQLGVNGLGGITYWSVQANATGANCGNAAAASCIMSSEADLAEDGEDFSTSEIVGVPTNHNYEGESVVPGQWLPPETAAATPEPGTAGLTLTGVGWLGLLMVMRRRDSLRNHQVVT